MIDLENVDLNLDSLWFFSKSGEIIFPYKRFNSSGLSFGGNEWEGEDRIKFKKK